MIHLLTFVFILSGAAGLIYESIWSRYLSLFVGHSAYAQIIVLVIFLGGLSAGAFLTGERSVRLRHPLLWYAAVEFVVGLIGFAFHHLFVGVTSLAYEHWFPALSGGVGLTIVKWGLAGLLILPQSVLLGATFPLMNAGAIRLRQAQTGHTLSLLYFSNSFGAAVGVLMAGFYLIAHLGLPGTLLIAAVLNFFVAMVVWIAVRLGDIKTIPMSSVSSTVQPGTHSNQHVAGSEEVPAHPSVDSLPRSLTERKFWRLMLAVSFGTAVASFIYEISWIRMLSLVLGSATHSFELILSAFILGLASGAFWIRRRADALANPVLTLGIIQWIMGSLAIATLPLYVASFRWMAILLETFRQSEAGYHGFGVARYVICILVMVPATFCAGITLPLITKMLIKAGFGERSIGSVYGVNMLGSIFGVVLAGLLLMPLVGLKMLLLLGALVDIGLGVWLLSNAAILRFARAPAKKVDDNAVRISLPIVALVATAFLVLATAVFVHFDRSILTSGVYRHAALPARGTLVVPFYRDGRTATVSVRRAANDPNGVMTLSTNGKPDASLDVVWRRPFDPNQPRVPLRRDSATQVLLPMITLAHAASASEGAVIGQGSGMSSHLLLGSPKLKRLTTIEIEPEMINASRMFLPANRRVFEDPRTRFVIDDAKSVFAASSHRFDLILSEPSNPWVSGVSGLFTVEFYERVKRQLSDEGVFGQWLHLYEIDDALVVSVLAALDTVFPSYEIFLTSNAELLAVASKRPKMPQPDWSVLQYSGVADDLRRVMPLGPGHMEAMRLVSRDVIHPYLARFATSNSDYYPILDLGTERTRFLHTRAEGVMSLGERRFDMVAALTGRWREPVTEVQAPAPDIVRVNSMALGARLRALRNAPGAGPDSLSGDDELRVALYRLRELQRALAVGAPPSDWRLWVRDVSSVERDLYTGTAGVVDESFYEPLRDYMRKTRAPAEVESAVAFLHGLAGWDWEEVSRVGDVLIAAQQRDEAWLPIDVLREGTVVAKLKQNDPNGARTVFKALAPFGASSFRERLLAAIVLSSKQ